MGGHDHDHAEHASEEDKSSIIKSLVAVLGVYVFFLFESGMSLIRERRKDKVRIVNAVSPSFDMCYQQMDRHDSCTNQSERIFLNREVISNTNVELNRSR